MKLYLDTIGCRLNHSEIETLARQLIANGHELVDDVSLADKVVINTCAVTTAAARDARRLTRRLHRQNEAAEILLTGCYASVAPEEVGRIQGAGRVVPNAQKETLIQIIDPQARIDLPIFDQEPLMREKRAGTVGHTRAFVKVQDGCKKQCTFCITTVARGESVSRHLGDVITEIQALEGAGYKEVVLTGVHIGSYGHDLGNRRGLRDLLQAILTYTTIPRIRLSSLEPWEIPEDFFNLWTDRRLLPHLHLPLQSGSDSVLKRMARATKQSAYRAIVAAARAKIPALNLTTDIIVGFPGETEAEFAESLRFVEEIGFSHLHAFSYSPRPGTSAADMPDQIDSACKKERVQHMIALGNKMGKQFYAAHVNHTLNVLWESVVGADKDGLRWIGYSDNYIRVQASGPEGLLNQVTPVKITGLANSGLQGELIPLPTSVP